MSSIFQVVVYIFLSKQEGGLRVKKLVFINAIRSVLIDY